VEAAPEVSACVVAWNAGERLGELLASLAAARAGGLALEAIVVDNASTDGTADRAAREHPWARLVRNGENRGYARAANQAAALAAGRLVLVLNDDVVVPAGALEALVRALDGRPDAVAAGPRLVGADGREQASQSGLPTLRGLLHRIALLRWTGAFRAAHEAWRRPPAPTAPAPVPCLCGAALLVRREALARVPFDEGYPFGLEDADLCARLGALGPLLHVPAVAFVHLGGAASSGNAAFVYRGFELGFARFVRLRQGRAAGLAYKALVTLDQPLRLAGALLEALGRLLGGRPRRARESLARAAAVARFALALPALWSA
jgi:GT2 family glycosyltransferase